MLTVMTTAVTAKRTTARTRARSTCDGGWASQLSTAERPPGAKPRSRQPNTKKGRIPIARASEKVESMLS